MGLELSSLVVVKGATHSRARYAPLTTKAAHVSIITTTFPMARQQVSEGGGERLSAHHAPDNS